MIFMIVSKTSTGEFMSMDVAPLIGINSKYLTLDDSTIVYECKTTDTLNPENIEPTPYYDFKKVLGLGDLMKSAHIQQIIDNISTSSRLFALVEANVYFASTVSASILGPNPDYIAARRCQSGQHATLYEITTCIPVCGEVEVEKGKVDSGSPDKRLSEKDHIVVNINHKKVSIPIHSGTTIGHIKQMLAVRYDYPVSIRLIHNGQELKKEDALVEKESVFTAMVRSLKGGTRKNKGRAVL